MTVTESAPNLALHSMESIPTMETEQKSYNDLARELDDRVDPLTWTISRVRGTWRVTLSDGRFFSGADGTINGAVLAALEDV